MKQSFFTIMNSFSHCIVRLFTNPIPRVYAKLFSIEDAITLIFKLLSYEQTTSFHPEIYLLLGKILDVGENEVEKRNFILKKFNSFSFTKQLFYETLVLPEILEGENIPYKIAYLTFINVIINIQPNIKFKLDVKKHYLPKKYLTFLQNLQGLYFNESLAIQMKRYQDLFQEDNDEKTLKNSVDLLRPNRHSVSLKKGQSLNRKKISHLAKQLKAGNGEYTDSSDTDDDTLIRLRKKYKRKDRSGNKIRDSVDHSQLSHSGSEKDFPPKIEQKEEKKIEIVEIKVEEKPGDLIPPPPPPPPLEQTEGDFDPDRPKMISYNPVQISNEIISQTLYSEIKTPRDYSTIIDISLLIVNFKEEKKDKSTSPNPPPPPPPPSNNSSEPSKIEAPQTPKSSQSSDPLYERGPQGLFSIEVILRGFKLQRKDPVGALDIIEALQEFDVKFFSDIELKKLVSLFPVSSSGETKYPNEEKLLLEADVNTLSAAEKFIRELYLWGKPYMKITSLILFKNLPNSVDLILKHLSGTFSYFYFTLTL